MALTDASASVPGGVQVIARAALLLRTLAGVPDGLSLSQVATRTRLPRSTVHRLLAALQAEGFVISASPSGRVRIGPDLVRIAQGSRRDVQQELRPVMEWLFDELHETVDLSLLDAKEVRFVDQIPAPHRLRAVSSPGTSFPLHCTANGKAILSLLPRDEVLARLPARLPACTPSTITSRRALLAELREIRASGVALDREEHTVGISAAGFAVASADGELAAVTVPMPTQRFLGREQDVVARLSTARLRAADAVRRGA